MKDARPKIGYRRQEKGRRNEKSREYDEMERGGEGTKKHNGTKDRWGVAARAIRAMLFNRISIR